MVLIYNLADTFFIGQTKNAYMVAAISVATPAFLLFMAVGMLFGIGGTSLISRSLGEGKTEKAKNASAFCFWTGLSIGIIAMLSIHPRYYQAGKGIATGVFAIGVPASLNSILMSLSNIIVNNIMTHYGDMAVAGLGVAMKVNMIVVMLLIGLGTGIQPLRWYMRFWKTPTPFHMVCHLPVFISTPDL